MCAPCQEAARVTCRKGAGAQPLWRPGHGVWLWEGEEGPEAGVVMGRLPLQPPQTPSAHSKRNGSPKGPPLSYEVGTRLRVRPPGLQTAVQCASAGRWSSLVPRGKQVGREPRSLRPQHLNDNWEPCSEPPKALGVLVSMGSSFWPWSQRACHELPEARWPSWTLSLQAGSPSVHPHHTAIRTPAEGQVHRWCSVRAECTDERGEGAKFVTYIRHSHKTHPQVPKGLISHYLLGPCSPPPPPAFWGVGNIDSISPFYRWGERPPSARRGHTSS